MWKAFNKERRSLWLYAAITFVVLLVITQLLVYQRYIALRDNERNELLHELDDTKDQLTVVMEHNLSSAKTVSLLYKQTRNLSWFDSIAKELMVMNEAIDIVYFVNKDFRIERVYPFEGNEKMVGFNLLSDPYRRAETKLALRQSKIVFGGPYDLVQGGGKAIAGRQPLFENNSFIGGAVVVTKLSTIRKRMPELDNRDDKFVYQLSKTNVLTKKTEYFFDGYDAEKGWQASAYMPRGDWILYAAYAKGAISHKTIILLSLFGILFSAMGAVFVYSRAYATVHLEEVVKLKTYDLGERMKELSTIYRVNEILQDDRQSTDIALSRIVKIIPQGWQYPNICAARIVIGEAEYKTENCAETLYKIQMPITLYDERPAFIEVSYIQETPVPSKEPFLIEEHNLLKALAETIEIFYNKKFQHDKMRRSEATLRSMIEACPMGVVLMDRDGRIVAINSNMAANYPVNTGRNMGVGDNFIDVLQPERRERVREVFAEVMEQLEPIEYDTSYPKDDGTVYFSVSVAPVVVNAEAIGICLVGIDVTRRKRLELDHERMIRELMNHMTTLVEFARTLNDKVRDPLAEIPVLSEQAKAEKEDAKRGEMLDAISKNAQHVASYVTRLDESLEEKR